MTSTLARRVPIPASQPNRTTNPPKRRSFLPQPNSIALRYVQKSRVSTIFEERLSQLSETNKCDLNNTQRPTVITTARTTNITCNTDETILNSTSTIPAIIVEDVKNEDLDESIEDKENIPPIPEEHHHANPLTENKARQFDNIDNLHLIGILRSTITKIDKLECDVQSIKSLVEIQSNQIQNIELMLKKMNINLSVNPISVSDVTSNSQILLEMPLENIDNANKENSNVDNKKNRRKSKEFNSERRRSARLAEKETPKKTPSRRDSFLDLETALNIHHSASKTAPNSNRTPKNRSQRPKPKSARSLREYLAMKACTSFLETPVGNGFKKNIATDDNTPSRQKNLRRSISTKLLDELNDLYDEDSGSVKSEEIV